MNIPQYQNQRPMNQNYNQNQQINLLQKQQKGQSSQFYIPNQIQPQVQPQMQRSIQLPNTSYQSFVPKTPTLANIQAIEQ